jgi:flagellar basal body-associated protein FliL
MASGKKIGCILLAGALIVGSAGIYNYHKEAVLDWLLEFRPGGRTSNDVDLFFMSCVDTKTLRVNLTVRCRDRWQKREVVKKEARIVSELIECARDPKLVASLENRHLEPLRDYWTETINETTGSPVESVHLDRFFFN